MHEHYVNTDKNQYSSVRTKLNIEETFRRYLHRAGVTPFRAQAARWLANQEGRGFAKYCGRSH